MGSLGGTEMALFLGIPQANQEVARVLLLLAFAWFAANVFWRQSGDFSKTAV